MARSHVQAPYVPRRDAPALLVPDEKSRASAWTAGSAGSKQEPRPRSTRRLTRLSPGARPKQGRATTGSKFWRAALGGSSLLIATVACEQKPPESERTHEVSSVTSAVPEGGSVLRLSVPGAPESPLLSADAGGELPKLGDDVKAQDYTLRALHVKECEVETYFRPSPGNLKLGVKVEFEGRSEREVPVNPFHATLIDSEGETYTATLAGCRPTLSSRRITKDERATGYVTFELPRTAKGLVLSYSPFVIGTRKQVVKVSLER